MSGTPWAIRGVCPHGFRPPFSGASWRLQDSLVRPQRWASDLGCSALHPGSPPPGWQRWCVCFLLCPKEALSQGRRVSHSGWGCLVPEGRLASWSWPPSLASPSNPAFIRFSPAPWLVCLSLSVWNLGKRKRCYLFKATGGKTACSYFYNAFYRAIICYRESRVFGDFDVPHSNVRPFLSSLGLQHLLGPVCCQSRMRSPAHWLFIIYPGVRGWPVSVFKYMTEQNPAELFRTFWSTG